MGHVTGEPEGVHDGGGREGVRVTARSFATAGGSLGLRVNGEERGRPFCC